MSEFWLGAFLALAVYYTLMFVLNAAAKGETFTVDYRSIVSKLVLAVVFFALANLTHIGLIL